MSLFLRISQRVETSRAQLQAISERVTLAQAKIEKIKGSKKAIKVVTPMKAVRPLSFFPPSIFIPEASSAEKHAAHPLLCALLLSSCDESPPSDRAS